MTRVATRRRFLQLTAAATAASALGGVAPRAAFGAKDSTGEFRGRIYKSIKFGMFSEDLPMTEKFQLLKAMGFDGVELSSPGGVDKAAAIRASRETGLRIHGAVNTVHWNTRLSDPDPAVREKSREALETSIKDVHVIGGTSVLLVPGKVTDPRNENQEQVWDRSIEQIRKTLPLASRLGVHILIENVWNGFCYIHDGPDNQTADLLARYIDTIASPWVGVYFDIGNHQKYGKPAEWIRTLGSRIVKLDVKDWGKKNGFSKIGAGDVDWAEVRRALHDIRFTGWATAEVRGGDRERIREIAANMDRALGL